MPGYCDVCNRSSSWFWSKYDNWWNPKLYCSFTCNAVGSWGEHTAVASFLTFIGLITIGSYGFLFFILALPSIGLAYYGYTNQDYALQFDGKTSVDYDKASQNFDKVQDDVLRDMY